MLIIAPKTSVSKKNSNKATPMSPGTKSGDLTGHRFTRPERLVQCESMVVIVWSIWHVCQATLCKTRIANKYCWPNLQTN